MSVRLGSREHCAIQVRSLDMVEPTIGVTMAGSCEGPNAVIPR